MDLVSSVDAPCAADVLFTAVEDLGGYPVWLSIVARAVPEAGDEPAWTVDLRGRLGPLARSKRLRMARTAHDPPALDHPGHVRFERRQRDGRDHNPWVLDATVEAVDGGSRLTMALHYGGSFGGMVLERMLRDEIERSRPRLLDLLASA